MNPLSSLYEDYINSNSKLSFTDWLIAQYGGINNKLCNSTGITGIRVCKQYIQELEQSGVYEQTDNSLEL